MRADEADSHRFERLAAVGRQALAHGDHVSASTTLREALALWRGAPLAEVDYLDQGTEMARHRTITRSLGAPVYFCDSHSPWQRGSNENTNGLLRDYFPKGTDLSTHSPQHLLAVENQLNNRPRHILNDRAPAELFTALLASENPPVLRR